MGSVGLRAAAYVDGLNLYHGMVEAELDKYRWLDIHGLCQQIAVDAGGRLGASIRLQNVTYCTSMVAGDKPRRRQDLYIQAIEAHRPGTAIVYGKYEEKGRDCECHCGCHNLVAFQKEKRTDVNLAVAILRDATLPRRKRPEVQIIVTGDSDLKPAMSAARGCGIKVVAAYPPARGRVDMKDVVDAWVRIGKRHLRDSPLPGSLVTTNGFPLSPPDGWTHPDDW